MQAASAWPAKRLFKVFRTGTTWSVKAGSKEKIVGISMQSSGSALCTILSVKKCVRAWLWWNPG